MLSPLKITYDKRLIIRTVTLHIIGTVALYVIFSNQSAFLNFDALTFFDIFFFIYQFINTDRIFDRFLKMIMSYLTHLCPVCSIEYV